MELNQAQKLIDSTFEEIALVLGGIFAVHSVPNEAVWQIMKHIDIAHENALGKLDGLEQKTEAPHESYKAHPAVEALLLKIKKRKPFYADEP